MNIIEAEILHRKLYAEYWLAMATTGTARERKVYKSVNSMADTELTDEEKVSRALSIALSHIQLLGRLIEKLPPESSDGNECDRCGKPKKTMSYYVAQQLAWAGVKSQVDCDDIPHETGGSNENSHSK